MTPMTPTNLIPTYEIVTSCQPAVVYSNGYYYTSFVPPNNSTVSFSSSPAVHTVTSCAACSCQQQQQQQVQQVQHQQHQQQPVSQWSVPPPPIHHKSS